MESNPLTFLDTPRGGKCLYYGGYKFHKIREDPRSRTIYWRCESWKSRQCPARCRGPAAATITTQIELTAGHNHEPYARKRRVDELAANMMIRAKVEETPIPEIYREEIQRIASEANALEIYQELPAFTSVSSTLYRKRRERNVRRPNSTSRRGRESRMSDEDFFTMHDIPNMNQPLGPSTSDEQGQEETDQFLLQPFHYILEVPGKSIRTKLTKAFNHWLDIDSDVCKQIGEVIQMLHNASLLIDDIEDNSRLRRGVPVAHQIFGVASTINAANYVYFLALEKLQKLGRSEVTQVFTEQLLELHRGQGMEIFWRDNYTCPSEEQYVEMVRRKTSSLFNLAVRLMQLFSTNDSDFTNLVAVLGLYFQIRDDYSNLKSEEYSANKSYCEDLTEGKFSFPIIHAIQQHPEAPQVLNILRQRTTDIEIKKYAVDLLERLGSFDYTLAYMKTLDAQARFEIDSLGGNPHLMLVLDELKTW